MKISKFHLVDYSKPQNLEIVSQANVNDAIHIDLEGFGLVLLVYKL